MRKGGALVLEKEWGQHTESLVGFLEGYELFNDIRYYEAFQTIWGFVNSKMISHQVGEWRRLLDRDGKLIDGNIGNGWKVAYRSGRSMMECDKRLQKLIKNNNFKLQTYDKNTHLILTYLSDCYFVYSQTEIN